MGLVLMILGSFGVFVSWDSGPVTTPCDCASQFASDLVFVNNGANTIENLHLP